MPIWRFSLASPLPFSLYQWPNFSSKPFYQILRRLDGNWHQIVGLNVAQNGVVVLLTDTRHSCLYSHKVWLRDLRLTAIKENAKFKNKKDPGKGIENIVKIAKEKYRLRHMYVWHAITGY
ncbi:hypothetical protein CsSME_00036044 [Camellia sinensis var. sinensis]